MFKFVIFGTLLAVASIIAAPGDQRPCTLPALKHEEVHDEYGQYALRYVTAEGTIVSERGRLVPNKENTGYVMITDGEVSYIGDDGKTYVTKYSGGLNGSKIEGSHLPIAPVAPAVA